MATTSPFLSVIAGVAGVWMTILAGPAAAQPAPAHPAASAPPTAHRPVRERPAAPAPGTAVRPRPAPHAVHAPAHRPPSHAAPAKPPVVAPVVPASVPVKPPEPTKGTATGLPLPRFVSLRTDTVNFRAGPGRQYPIEWVYQRRDLPVEIDREFENWRLVQDPDGTKGWVHQATLAPRRTGVIVGAEQVLRSDARDDAAEMARLKPGVIVRLRSCAATAAWCQASVQDYRGWIRRTDVWGLLPNEEVQ